MLLDGEEIMAIEVTPTRRRFSRHEYYQMAAAGILSEDDRVELVRGEIVVMSPIGRRHVTFVDNLNRLLVLRLGDRAIVSVQSPIALDDDTDLQPDLAVYRRSAVSHKDRDRGPDDAVLIIEIAETSLRYDRTTKLRLYAEAGILEYWVVNATAEHIDIYLDPHAGAYRRQRRIVNGDGATVSPQAFPDVVLPLTEVFA